MLGKNSYRERDQSEKPVWLGRSVCGNGMQSPRPSFNRQLSQVNDHLMNWGGPSPCILAPEHELASPSGLHFLLNDNNMPDNPYLRTKKVLFPAFLLQN